jgi:tetratricopeptide (TPR) repeat protein
MGILGKTTVVVIQAISTNIPFMSYSYDTLTSNQKLNLPRDRVNTQVQKLHQQGNDSAFRGEHDRAIAHYTQALAIDPHFVSAYCARGSASIELKNYPQAKTDYEMALKLSPGLAVANGGLARAYYGLGDHRAALIACDRAIQRDPENLNFYYDRALVNKKLADYDRVLLDCKFILERQPSEISVRWLNARAHFQLGNYQLAIFNFNQYLNLQFNDAYAYYYRGICCERLNDLLPALQDLNRALDLQDDRAIFYRRRGRIAQLLGDFTSAMTDYDRAISLDPHMAQAYVNRANIYLSRGDYSHALIQCNQAIQLDLSLASAYYQRGIINTEIGNIHAALADYHRLIQLNPHDLNAYLQRGWIYFRHGEYTAVMSDCGQIFTLLNGVSPLGLVSQLPEQKENHHLVATHYLMGVVQSLSGFKQEAIFSFTKAIDAEPNFICALYHRGLLHYDLKHEQKATIDFNLAQEIQNQGLASISERDETGLYAEGLALYYMGQLETSRSILYQAMLVSRKLKSTIFCQQIMFTIEALDMN